MQKRNCTGGHFKVTAVRFSNLRIFSKHPACEEYWTTRRQHEDTMAGSHRYCLIRPSDNVTRQASLELSGGAAEDFSLNFRPRLPVSVSPPPPLMGAAVVVVVGTFCAVSGGESVDGCCFAVCCIAVVGCCTTGGCAVDFVSPAASTKCHSSGRV